MTKKESSVLEKTNVGEKSLFTINDVAKILNVHQQTLRNWERKKVVVPLRAGTRRIYTAAHVELCKKIREFSGKGVSLKGIKEILNKI
jgi:MerR family transcriptional regulator/heat shock protein HspR